MVQERNMRMLCNTAHYPGSPSLSVEHVTGDSSILYGEYFVALCLEW